MKGKQWSKAGSELVRLVYGEQGHVVC